MTLFCSRSCSLSSPPPVTGISPFLRHGTAGRRRDVFLVLLFQKFEQIGYQGLLEKVAFQATVDEVIDDMVRAQKFQVLRHVRLADIEGLLEVAHALYSLHEISE